MIAFDEAVKSVIDELSVFRNANSKTNNQHFHRQGATGPVIRMPIVRRISLEQFKKIQQLPIKRIFVLCEQLLRTNREEEKTIAFDWAYRSGKKFVPADFSRLERWLKQHVNDWSDCDDLCCRPFGSFLLSFPQKIDSLTRWAVSRNRWIRRASAVAVIPSLRKGKQMDFAFGIADLLLTDDEYLVQKGYGWMLKEASRHFPDEVFQFVMERKRHMPRTALRYAIEKLPAAKRKEAMLVGQAHS